MDTINEKIREEDEYWELEDAIMWERLFAEGIV
jgi:hypothetical protein